MLRGNEIEAGDGDLVARVVSCGLASLDVRGNSLAPRDGEALAAALEGSGLAELLLGGNDLGPVGRTPSFENGRPNATARRGGASTDQS